MLEWATFIAATIAAVGSLVRIYQNERLYHGHTNYENKVFRRSTTRRCVNGYAFRYNHREDGQAMFSAVANRANKVRSGKHRESFPIGE
jgi:hypothetical protein